jgi:hypothetical protein
MKYAFGFAEHMKNNKEFDASDRVKREKMLGQRNQKREKPISFILYSIILNVLLMKYSKD